MNKHPKLKLRPEDYFYIKLPVKPYVKAYLENKFGDPVWFCDDKNYYNMLRDWLEECRKKEQADVLPGESPTITILLTPTDFHRYGWKLNRKAMVQLNKVFEADIKKLMRLTVGISVSLGKPLFNSILKFQQRHGFDENVWPFESIKKDFFRNGYKNPIDFKAVADKLTEPMEKISDKILQFGDNNQITDFS